ncbi:hypothetical protein T492DRAFT_1147069 [Pavlovales sp. CCMP2436]|nr:hypothetical protein T492DRAFT_1147069 [Pavlovales sp. CCMP2436]
MPRETRRLEDVPGAARHEGASAVRHEGAARLVGAPGDEHDGQSLPPPCGGPPATLSPCSCLASLTDDFIAYIEELDYGGWDAGAEEHRPNYSPITGGQQAGPAVSGRVLPAVVFDLLCQAGSDLDAPFDSHLPYAFDTSITFLIGAWAAETLRKSDATEFLPGQQQRAAKHSSPHQLLVMNRGGPRPLRGMRDGCSAQPAKRHSQSTLLYISFKGN